MSYSRQPDMVCSNAASYKYAAPFTLLPNGGGIWMSGGKYWQKSYSDALEYQKQNAMIPRNRTKRKNRMKIARSKGTHTKAEWLALCAEFDFACVQCGSKDNIQKDHIDPVREHEGSDAIKNIQPLCRFCNISKRAEDNTNWVAIRRAEKKNS